MVLNLHNKCLEEKFITVFDDTIKAIFGEDMITSLYTALSEMIMRGIYMMNLDLSKYIAMIMPKRRSQYDIIHKS